MEPVLRDELQTADRKPMPNHNMQVDHLLGCMIPTVPRILSRTSSACSKESILHTVDHRSISGLISDLTPSSNNISTLPNPQTFPSHSRPVPPHVRNLPRRSMTCRPTSLILAMPSTLSRTCPLQPPYRYALRVTPILLLSPHVALQARDAAGSSKEMDPRHRGGEHPR